MVRAWPRRVTCTPACAGALERLDGLARRHVLDVDAPLLVGGERAVAGDHRRLRHRGDPAQAERAETSPSCITPSPDSARVLLVQREHPTGEPLVLERLPHDARRSAPAARRRVKPAAPASLSSAISVSCSPACPRVIAARKPVGTRASARARSRSERSTGGAVDHRIGVGHRQDRAVAAGGRGAGAGVDVLLVLPSRACAGARAGRRRPGRRGGRSPPPPRRPRAPRARSPCSAISPSRISRSAVRVDPRRAGRAGGRPHQDGRARPAGVLEDRIRGCGARPTTARPALLAHAGCGSVVSPRHRAPTGAAWPASSS